MNDEQIRSQGNSTQTSRLSTYSGRHFDFFDTHHSVFSRNSYYNDMHTIHPWSRRPCSRNSGIPYATLRSKSCSSRLDDLSRPKISRERLVRQEILNNLTNYGSSGVKPTALTAQCSNRLITLSQPKKPPKGYTDAYVLPKVVSKQAVHAQVSNRIYELAKPHRNITLLNSIWIDKQKKIVS